MRTTSTRYFAIQNSSYIVKKKEHINTVTTIINCTIQSADKHKMIKDGTNKTDDINFNWNEHRDSF